MKWRLVYERQRGDFNEKRIYIGQDGLPAPKNIYHSYAEAMQYIDENSLHGKVIPEVVSVPRFYTLTAWDVFIIISISTTIGMIIAMIAIPIFIKFIM